MESGLSVILFISKHFSLKLGQSLKAGQILLKSPQFLEMPNQLTQPKKNEKLRLS